MEFSCRLGTPSGLLDRQDVKALLLEFTAEAGLAVSDVDAFDDLAARCAEPASEFHLYGEFPR